MRADTDDEMDDETVLAQLTERGGRASRRRTSRARCNGGAYLDGGGGEDDGVGGDDRSTRQDAADQLKLDYPPDFLYAPRMRQLYERLGARGHEPVMPPGWRLDFPLLPHALFFGDEAVGARYASIKSLAAAAINANSAGAGTPSRSTSTSSVSSTSETHGKFALERLLGLGAVIRSRHDLARLVPQDDLPACGVPARSDDATIVDQVRQFARWAGRDGGLSERDMSRFLIFCSAGSLPLGRERRRRRIQRKRPTEAEDAAVLAQLETEIERRLRELAALHREAGHRYIAAQGLGGSSAECHDDPHDEVEDAESAHAAQALAGSIYCIAACDQSIAVVSLACRDAGSPLRTLQIANLLEAGQDLWTMLAIALTVMTAREECLDAKQLALPTDDTDLLAQFERLRVQDQRSAAEDDIDR